MGGGKRIEIQQVYKIWGGGLFFKVCSKIDFKRYIVSTFRLL